MLPLPFISFFPNNIAPGHQLCTKLCVRSCKVIRDLRLSLPSKTWGSGKHLPNSHSSRQVLGREKSHFLVEMSVVREKIRTHRQSKEEGRAWRIKGNICEVSWEETAFKMFPEG